MKKNIKTLIENNSKATKITQQQMNSVKGGKSRPPKTGGKF